MILESDNLYKRLLNILMFQSDFITDLGLFYGKMGLVIFFANYAKKQKNSLIDEVADELMINLIEKLHDQMGVDLATGLSGIGWGIEYLIQNGFMENDSNEICKEIDLQIMKQDPRRFTDMSVEKGLVGVLHYVMARLKGNSLSGKVPFDDMYLNDMYTAVKKIMKTENCSIKPDLKYLLLMYIEYFENKKNNYELLLPLFIEVTKLDMRNLCSNSIGLNNGIAGYLLKEI